MITVKGQGHSTTVPTRLNFLLAAMHVVLSLYQFFVLPIYLLPVSIGWTLTLVPIAALNNSFWSLIHEAIHDMFNSARRVNMVVGRLLSVLFGSPFRVLRLSHLLHHRLNRSPLEGTELYDPEKLSKLRASLSYYFQILGGLYLFEVISSLPFFLPRRFLRHLEQRYFSQDNLRGMLVRSLMKDESIREMRRDGLAILVFFGLSAWCYGKQWVLLASVLIIRALLISFLDNVYHYRTPVNDLFYANNLWLPRFLSGALLNFNLHGIHHRNPAIPWIKLPEVFKRESGRFDGSYFSAATRQLAGAVPLSELPAARRQGA